MQALDFSRVRDCENEWYEQYRDGRHDQETGDDVVHEFRRVLQTSRRIDKFPGETEAFRQMSSQRFHAECLGGVVPA